MLYLSGSVTPAILAGEPKVGLIITPNMRQRPDLARVTWAADNGCFSQGHTFRLGRYLTWLEETMSAYRPTCLFATAPDVVADAQATWVRSAPVLPVIRSLGYAVALVAQDGIEHEPIEWAAFDALFLGGSTAWKLSSMAAEVAREAKARGKWVHMGRVNSAKRWRIAHAFGCDSCDGTYLAYGPIANMPAVRAWVRSTTESPSLWRI